MRNAFHPTITPITTRDSTQAKMINFISGTVFGIIVATIGFAPVAGALDGIMFNLQKTTVEMSAPKLPPPDFGNK